MNHAVKNYGSVSDGREDAAAQFVRTEAIARVRAAVDELPPQQRTVILLRCYEGFADCDLCEAMDLSLEAVKSVLFRARQNLELALQDDIELVLVFIDPGRTRKDLPA